MVNPGDMKVKKFITQINESYGKGKVIEIGGRLGNLNIPRFSSGSVDLDCALGGGWPMGRISLIAGQFSTGKTALTLKAAGEIKKIDSRTKVPISQLSEAEQKVAQPCRTLFVDVEGAFDVAWATLHGFDPEYDAVCRPDFSEQTIDLVSAAMQDNVFDLIIIDSIAAMTPGKEIEVSAEEQQMGLAARLNNKAFRKWNASLNKVFQTIGKPGPTLMVLNQLREKIGVMFGDPRVLPGGKGQEFNASITVYTKSQKYDSKEGDKVSKVTLAGTTKKNKTFIPNQQYEFDMWLDDSSGQKAQIDNAFSLFTLAKKHKLLKTGSGKVTFGTKEYSNQKEFKDRLTVSPTLQSSVWKSVVKAATGYSYKAGK